MSVGGGGVSRRTKNNFSILSFSQRVLTEQNREQVEKGLNMYH